VNAIEAVDESVRLSSVVFGKVIEGLRSFHGLEQADLAKKSGVSGAAISRLERGKSNPSLATVLALAQGLGLTPSELLRAFELAYSEIDHRVSESRLESKTMADHLSTGRRAAAPAAVGGASASVAGKALARTFPMLGLVALAGPVGMAVGAVISGGVFTALTNFLAERERAAGETGSEGGGDVGD
jgi:transcriptional regulator with XRE-family HTH domain